MAVFNFNKILISPYMTNGNLLRYLKKEPDLDRCPILIQVATAVDFLHVKHRLIHGDLKCENVLVADDGTPQLADFGLSTIIEKTDVSTRTATALRQQATIQFAAPELFFGESDSMAIGERGRPARRTPKTDIYAFGMLVLQAFTGRPPWSGCSSTEILMKLHLQVLHPRPENGNLHQGITNLWWESCVTCWAHDPSERPTMRELIKKLGKRRHHIHPPQPVSRLPDPYIPTLDVDGKLSFPLPPGFELSRMPPLRTMTRGRRAPYIPGPIARRRRSVSPLYDHPPVNRLPDTYIPTRDEESEVPFPLPPPHKLGPMSPVGPVTHGRRAESTPKPIPRPRRSASTASSYAHPPVNELPDTYNPTLDEDSEVLFPLPPPHELAPMPPTPNTAAVISHSSAALRPGNNITSGAQTAAAMAAKAVARGVSNIFRGRKRSRRNAMSDSDSQSLSDETHNFGGVAYGLSDYPAPPAAQALSRSLSQRSTSVEAVYKFPLNGHTESDDATPTWAY